MKPSEVILVADQELFWKVVRDCIREFHSVCAKRSLEAATRLRRKVNAMPIEELELFYHAEPFEVACNLAERPLDVRQFVEPYLRIRDSIAKRKSA